MKFLLVFLVVALCAQDALSFFGTLQSKSLIKEVQTAKASGEDTTEKIAETIGNIASVNVPEFINATDALSSLIYVLSNIDEYFTKFERSLNSQVISGVTLVNNINILLTQINTYVLPSIMKINEAGPAIAGAFGEDNAIVITRVYESMDETFNSTVKTFTTCKERIVTATAKGVQIDSSNFNQYTKMEDFEKIENYTADFVKDMKILKTIINGFLEVSRTIRSISDCIELTVQESRGKFTKALRDFDFAVTNANTLQELGTDKIIATLVEKTAVMNNVISEIYFDNINMTIARQTFNRDISSISINFMQATDYFLGALHDMETNVKTNATIASVKSTDLVTDVVEHYAVQIGLKGKTGIKCLKTGTHGEATVKKFVAEVIGNATKCVEEQTKIVDQVNSKLLFKKEDVQLNFLGASDKMCGCLNKTLTNDDEIAVACIETAIVDIHNTTTNDISYIGSYVSSTGGSLIELLQLSPATFMNCTLEAVAGFEAAFNNTKLETLSCLAN